MRIGIVGTGKDTVAQMLSEGSVIIENNGTLDDLRKKCIDFI